MSIRASLVRAKHTPKHKMYAFLDYQKVNKHRLQVWCSLGDGRSFGPPLIPETHLWEMVGDGSWLARSRESSRCAGRGAVQLRGPATSNTRPSHIQSVKALNSTIVDIATRL